MKKQFITLLVCGIFASVSYGQTKFGVGGAYFNDLGIQARAAIDLGDKLDIAPSFTYWLADFGTQMTINGNVHYDVATLGDDIPIYAKAGLGLWLFSSSGFSNNNLGLNLGAGTIINEHIYAEIGITKIFDGGSDLGISVGYYF